MRIESVEEIRPLYEHGAIKVTGCTWNLSYVVHIDQDPQGYVFRFNRRRYGKGDETIEREQKHYSLIASNTTIPTPRIHRADVGRSIVPTGYMVMDFMPGQNLGFLTHPQNPNLTDSEKRQVWAAAGDAVAQLHAISQPAKSSSGGRRRVIESLDSLDRLVGDRSRHVTSELIVL